MKNRSPRLRRERCHARALRGAFALFLVVISAPVFANVVTIDDFTEGPVPAPPGPVFGPMTFQIPGLAPHATIGGQREIEVETGAYIHGTSTNGLLEAFVIPTGGVWLRYDTPPVDITGFGRNQYIELSIGPAGGFQIDLWLKDINGVIQQATINAANNFPEIKFYFYAFPNVDLAQVVRLEFRFRSLAAPLLNFVPGNIRASGEFEVPLAVGLDEIIEVGPPFPLPPFTFDLSAQLPSGVLLPMERLSLTLQQAVQLPDQADPLPVEVHSFNLVPDPDLTSFSGGWAVMESAAPKADHIDGVFDILVALLPFDPHTPGEVDLLSGPIIPHSRAFLVPFEAVIQDVAGGEVGVTALALQGYIPDGLGLSFNDVQVAPSPVGGPAFTLHFELLVSGAVPKQNLGHLFNLTVRGDLTPTGVLTAAPPARSSTVVLTASPSVMGERTQIRLSRTLDRAEQIQLFDVAGREVRTLELGAGQPYVVWDGRDDRGRRVASGVYLARLARVRTTTSAKIVKLK